MKKWISRWQMLIGICCITTFFAGGTCVSAESFSDEGSRSAFYDAEVPEAAIPESLLFFGQSPEETLSEGTVPEGTTPGGTTPEGTTPGGTTPEGTTPGGTIPEEPPQPPKKNGLKKENGKLYFYKDGVKVKYQWVTVDGLKYFFKKNGEACTENVRIDGKVYVFRLNGRLVQPSAPCFVKVNGEKYYVNSQGQAYTGSVKVGSKVYIARSGGRIVTPEKTCFVTVDNNKYYVNPQGQAATGNVLINGKVYVFRLTGRLVRPEVPRFVLVDGKRYYANTSGQASTGWMIVNGCLYCADDHGVLWTNRSYEGINFDRNGKAENNISAQLKMKVMSIVPTITDSSMSSSSKLRACWNYVVSRRNFSYMSKYPNMNEKGWQKRTALDMLTTHTGNCYSFACAFAALAAEVGYEPYIVCGRVAGTRDGAADGLTRHGWVRINGTYYDPEAEFAGFYPGLYGLGGYYIRHTIQQIIDFRNSV